MVVETFLLNIISYNYLSFIHEYWDFITSNYHQNGLLQFVNINLEQTKTLISYVLQET